MMTIIMQIAKTMAYIAPFVFLCIATRKVNLNPADRGRQFLMPFIALIYCIVAVWFMDGIVRLFLNIITVISSHISFLKEVTWSKYITYIFNIGLVTTFLAVKAIMLPILNRIWRSYRFLMEKTSGICYEYEEDIDKWLLKKEYGQVKFYYTGIYYSALAVSTIVFVMSQVYPDLPVFSATFSPVFGVIVLGEVINFLSGITKSEFVEDILGEDEASYKIANYGLLRGVLRDLFEDRVLYDTTIDNGLDGTSAFDSLEEMSKSDNALLNSLGKYFTTLKESGKNIDPSYVKSCVNLLQGQSTLFCNPFYRDLTDYVMFPMIRQLMRYRKCLVVMGRDSATDDVKEWLEQGILEHVHTDSLWKVDILSREVTEADIAIIKFCDLHNLEIQKNNEEFLSRVGFVFIVEPSKLLATGQMGLSLLVNRFDESKEKVVYSACDRNCDGLVDALSHTLKTNITEVTATTQGGATTSIMCWDADGEYMHHKIFSNVSRYMGVGTEINAVAMKYQISNTAWISSDKFPVLDMKWLAGQYYKKICNYTNLPVSQDAFNKAFHVESNLWNVEKRTNSFLVVEDEFQNLFELTRVFSTRAQQQGFINVISENYLLRDYMLDNVKTFIADPKAIPTIVADYSRTERNIVLKLIMRMAEEQVSEDEIVQALEVSGIEFQDPFEKLKSLIHKHCFVNEINIRVYFREKLMADALRTEVKKYYAIEGETEIAKYAENLKNAYYIAEDEKGEIYHIGAKLYGHIFQALVPGQFLTFAGKYYEVQSITPQNGVVVRRAADHIDGRKYYRQIRHIGISDWKNDENVGGQKTISDIRVEKGYCQIKVDTDGYIEMQSYEDLKTAKKIHVSGIPQRTYRNKLVMKLNLPGASESIRYTICLLLNEIFKTTYPDAYHYISAVTPLDLETSVPGNLKYAMYTMESDSDQEAIYIVEDSEIDLGLIASVERNIKRYFEIITEVLTWHDLKMHEKPEKQVDDYGISFDPDAEEEPEQKPKKQGFFWKIWYKVLGWLKALWNKILSLFKKKPAAPEVEAAPEETSGEVTEASEEAADQAAEAPEETTDQPIETPEETSEEAAEAPEEVVDQATEAPAETADETEETPEESEETVLRDTNCDQLQMEGEDEELAVELTKYQKSCYLKYGYEEFDEFLDFKGTVDYLTKYGYNHSPLSQVRDQEKLVDEYEKVYNPHKEGAHFCDFCGIEIAGGEYELLKDGRERCNQCSATALRTGEEFKKVFKTVMRNMEMFYGIKFNVAIKVRMTDAKKIAAHFGEEFVATPGFDGRTLGFAQKDSTGYSIYVENGSPKLAAMATIAHELTHIWQYQNWDDRKITQKYGANKKLEIYEGMAKWAEIQYLLCLNEVSYAKRQEIITQMRNDAYGRGFIRYRANYPLTVGSVLTGPTPFNNPDNPLDLAYCGAITGNVPYGEGGSTPVSGVSGGGQLGRKSKKRKVLITLLCLLLLALGIFTLSNRDNKPDKDITTSGDVIDDDTEDDTDDVTEDEFDDKTANTPYYAYELLSAEEQEMYQLICDAIEKHESSVSEIPAGIKSSQMGKINNYILADHGEYFYQSRMMWYYDASTDNVTKVVIEYCMTQEEEEKRQQEIDKVAETFHNTIDANMSEYEIALEAYNFIIQLIDYDSVGLEKQEAEGINPAVPDDLRSVYGVFVNKKAVCAGYARAMQYLLQPYDIECTYVWSDEHGEDEAHAWNLVKLEDDYYYVDATWGDGSNTLPEKDYSDETNYAFFGITTEELLRLSSHIPVDAVPLPECTEREYNYFNQEGLMVEAYDFEKIKTIVCDFLNNGEYTVAFKCTSKEVYKECLETLVNQKKMWDIITYVNDNLPTKIKTDEGYTYYNDEELYTLKFVLSEQ